MTVANALLGIVSLTLLPVQVPDNSTQSVSTPASSPESTGMRKWTNRANGKQVVATFLRIEGTTVYFRRHDGATRRCDIDALIAEDQQIIRNGGPAADETSDDVQRPGSVNDKSNRLTGEDGDEEATPDDTEAVDGLSIPPPGGEENDNSDRVDANNAGPSGIADSADGNNASNTHGLWRLLVALLAIGVTISLALIAYRYRLHKETRKMWRS